LRARPEQDFHNGRSKVRQSRLGVLFLPLLNFLRGLTGRASDEVKAVLGYAPGDRLSKGNIPRMQNVSFELIAFLKRVSGG
jgi:hypothetical protein